MASFDDFLEAVKDGAKDLAKEIFGGFENEERDDAKAYLG